MTLTTGPNLGLLVNGNAGEGHYTELMKQWRGIDGLVMPNAKGYLTNTPPGSPSDGDLYIISAAPTGAWAGQGGKVTRWSSVANAWEFYAPKNGWMVQSNSAREVYRYTGGAWEIYYKDGTWTPTIYGRTTAGTPTYVERSGKYTRLGNLVTIGFDIKISAKGGMSGGLAMGGLPFAMTCDNAGGGGQINYQSGNSAGIASLLRFNGMTAFYLVFNTAGGVTADLTDTNIADETRLIGLATFFI